MCKETSKNNKKETGNSFGCGYALQDGDKRAFLGAAGNGRQDTVQGNMS